MIAQANLAFNRHKGTMRGMHFQFPARRETKLVRCTRGAILDIIVDLRPESPTYLEHVAVELSADNHRALYVPERFAHGYQVLEDNTETSYQVGEFYAPGHEGGLRYDDPASGSSWPLPVSEISEKDRVWPLLSEVEPRSRARMAAAESLTGVGPMMIVDDLLQAREREGRPIRVGMIGAGFMAQGLANTIVTASPECRSPPSTAGGSSVRPRSTRTPASRTRGGDDAGRA